MTVEEAKNLKRNDFILYNNEKYKVLHVKELRSASANEIYMNIKCRNKNCTAWIMNEFCTIV